MSENNFENLENEAVETVQSEEVAAEEVIEEIAAEEVVEEITAEEVAVEEIAVEPADDDHITEADVAQVDLEELAQGATGTKAAVIAGGIAAIVLAIVALLFSTGIVNIYEWGYVDTTGVTLKELADKSGYSLSEYKKANKLPAMMHSSTFENAVNNNVKLGAIVAQSGMPLDEFKKYYGWGDDVTEKTKVGEALGKTKLSMMVGEESLDAFKEYYGFGDEVTVDTTYAEVRKVMDTKAKEERIKKEKEAKKAEEEAEAEPEVEAEPEAEAE